MVYNSVSIDSVIGKVIRDTRVQDTSYLIDMHEWIPEVLSLLRYEAPLLQEYKDVEIFFHKGKLPCGLIYIDAIEHCGRRLREGNSVKNIRTSKITDPSQPKPETWTSGVTKTPTPDGNGIWLPTLTKVMASPFNDKAYYQLEMGYVLTSFESGKVRVHYKCAPHDERGLPLIPDNQALKECIYYYVRDKMGGTGYEEKYFKPGECYARFERYLEVASAQIDFPSPDQMEHRVNTFARFIPPDHYYEGFFRVSGPEPFYDPMGPFDTYYI